MSDTAEARVNVAKSLMDFAIEVAKQNEAAPHIGIFVGNVAPQGTVINACANVLQMGYSLFGDNYGTGPCLIHVVGGQSAESIADAVEDAVMPVQRGSVIVIRTDGNARDVQKYAKMLDLDLYDKLNESEITYTVKHYS